MKLLIATSNSGKVKEFREMLGGDRFTWDDLCAHREIAAPDETGLTFRANAMLKAAYYAQRLNTWAMADDSGLEVDALDRKPGVHSARWAEMHHAGIGDVANNQLLLKQLAAATIDSKWPVFPARFACVLALADPAGTIIFTTRGTVGGRIIDMPRGENGFGYDPLFLIDELQKTTAELEPDEKHRISHRGCALRRMRDLMNRHLK